MTDGRLLFMIYATLQINRSCLKIYTVAGFDFSIFDDLVYAADTPFWLTTLKIE